MKKNEFDYNILRANDIRGDYSTQINKEVAYIIGYSFGRYLTNNKINKCLVGHDNRLSSDILNQSLKNGIKDASINLVDLGLVTTAMFNYGSIHLNIPYGIMITASHNKASDNGFKIFGTDFLHLSQDELQKLYEIIRNYEYQEFNVKGKEENVSINLEYIKMITSKFKQLNKKVVVDCGNGTASIIIKDIFNKLIKNVEYINCTSDGSFPIHNPDPNEEKNLKWLAEKVRYNRADVGIAVDGDADRVGIVDENGKMIPTDYLVSIFASDIIPNSENKTVIIDVKSSTASIHEIKKIGGNPLVVKNGSAYLEKVIHDHNCMIGGEYSGHIFFKDKFYGFDDGIYAALRFIELLDKVNQKASSLTANMLHLVNTPEIRIEVAEEKKEPILNEIKEYCISKNYKLNLVDGVRADFDEGFSLIRASNTGPTITLRFEAGNKKYLDEQEKEFMNIVNKYLK